MNHRILAPLLTLGVALSACASDDDTSDSPDPTTTAAAAATDAPSQPASTTPADTAPAATATQGTDPDTTTGSTGTDGVDSTTGRSTPGTGTGTGTAGAPGLDASFGTDGVLATPISTSDHDRFISVVEGPDGMLYASGFTARGDDHMFAVSRFDADGRPDESFGDGGVATVNVTEGGGSAEVARGLVVDADGRVVVSGPTEADPTAEGDAAGDLDVVVIRLDADGSLDPTFGDGGIAQFDLGAGKSVDDETYITDNVWGITARDGGYAVMAVTPNQEPDRTDLDFAIVGITESGELDAGFATNGVVTADLDATGDNARNIATQEDGTIVATGYSRDGDGVVSPVLIRLTADGELDESFGDGGIANHVILPGVTESYQVAVQGDAYVLAGYGRGDDSEEKVDMVVYRFGSDGSWDESFGTEGVTRIDLAGEDDRGRNLAVLPDGNILVVGSGKLDADDADAMAVMLDPDGNPIETFGDRGHLLVDLGGPGDGFFGVAVASDGRSVVLAGFKGADPEGADKDDSVLARLSL